MSSTKYRSIVEQACDKIEENYMEREAQTKSLTQDNKFMT